MPMCQSMLSALTAEIVLLSRALPPIMFLSRWLLQWGGWLHPYKKRTQDRGKRQSVQNRFYLRFVGHRPTDLSPIVAIAGGRNCKCHAVIASCEPEGTQLVSTVASDQTKLSSNQP